MKTLRYGIEIETVGLNRERLARAIQTVTGGNVVNEGRGWRVTDATGRAWQVVPDGSLSGGEQSGEVVSPVLTYADLDTLQNIIRAVRAALMAAFRAGKRAGYPRRRAPIRRTSRQPRR